MAVRHAHLDVSEDVAFVDPLSFNDDFRLIADVAFLSGASQGFAGVFVRHGASYYALAARPSGEYRVFEGSSPLRPVGGRGWRKATRPTPAGFWRLGIERRGDRFAFSIDGSVVGELHPAEARSSREAASPSRGDGALQVGLLSAGVTSRWKNFVAGGGDGFRPDEHTDWGTAADARGMLDEFQTHLKSFPSRPSRRKLFSMLATLSETRRALQSGPEWKLLATAADKKRATLQRASQRIGELDLFERGWEAVVGTASKRNDTPSERERGLLARAREAESRGNWGLALALYATLADGRYEDDLRAPLASLKKRLRPLRWHFNFTDRTGSSSPSSDSLFTKGESFWPVARSLYGALPWHGSGKRGKAALEIRVVARSVKDLSVEKKARPVAVQAGGIKRQKLERRLEQLESRLQDDLKDALVHAELAEQSSNVFGPDAQEPMKTYAMGQKQYRLRILDGEKLRKMYSRIETLRDEIEELGGDRARDYHSVPALRYTYFVMAEVSTEVLVDGEPVVRVERERSRRGLVQWKHGADRRRGIAASFPSQKERRQLDRSIGALALSRFRTAISLQNVLAKVPPEKRLTLLVRMARSAPHSELVENLQMALKNELQLRGAALERVTDRMLAGSG